MVQKRQVKLNGLREVLREITYPGHHCNNPSHAEYDAPQNREGVPMPNRMKIDLMALMCAIQCVMWRMEDTGHINKSLGQFIEGDSMFICPMFDTNQHQRVWFNNQQFFKIAYDRYLPKVIQMYKGVFNTQHVDAKPPVRYKYAAMDLTDPVAGTSNISDEQPSVTTKKTVCHMYSSSDQQKPFEDLLRVLLD